MRAINIVIPLLLLSACASMEGRVAALKEKKPTAENFPQALASEYLAYAQALAEEGHPIKANHFANKGLIALEEGDVELEEKPALDDSRQALLAVLTPDVKEVAPTKAARAQLLFDCWTVKQTVCAESFGEALGDLQEVADALVHGGDNRFAINFAAGSAELSPENSAIVALVAKRVAGYGEYQVHLSASGGKAKQLTSKRILVLEKALIARGVDAGRIHVEGKNKGKGKEVTLSIDRAGGHANSVVISIDTYTQPGEKSP